MFQESFSYSKIDTYNQCPFKYKLTYVDGHHYYSDSVATEFGSLVHSTEETIGKALMVGNPIDYIGLKNAFIRKTYELEYKYKYEWEIPDKAEKTYVDKTQIYLNSGIYRLEKLLLNNPNLEIIGLEQGFELQYNGHLFKGFIDRLFRDKETGNYLIQDIKTYSQELEPKKLKTPLQFVIYALAVKNQYHCSDDYIRCQYELPLLDMVQEAGEANWISRGYKQLDKFFMALETTDFVPNPTPLCHWCQFCPTNQNQPEEAKNLCPYFSVWTRENKNNKPMFEWCGPEAHESVLRQYIKTTQKADNQNGEINGK